jgi:hypothetical protein
MPSTHLHPASTLGSIKYRGESSKRNGRQGKAEVPKRNVEVTRESQQVQDDSYEPGRDEIAAEARPEPNDESRDDLDDADDEHQGVTTIGDSLAIQGARYWSQLTRRWVNLSMPATVKPTRRME